MTILRGAVRLPAPIVRPHRPPVVELVGLAAAGKSSLLDALDQEGLRCRMGLRPPKRLHIRSAAALLPTFLGLRRSAPGVRWKEMKRMVYLRTLRRELSDERLRRLGAVVLDEGPVYMMARMRVHGGPKMLGAAFLPWWRAATREWAETLDLLVWLDAPEAVLVERIRSRSQYHRLQTADDTTLHEFLLSYRAAYADLMSALVTDGWPRVLAFRTDLEPPSRIAAQVAAVLRRRGL